MKKILRLQSALLKEIDKYEKLVPERSHFIDWERVHITSCAKIGYMLAGALIRSWRRRPVQCTITDESSPASSRAMRKPDICRFRSF